MVTAQGVSCTSVKLDKTASNENRAVAPYPETGFFAVADWCRVLGCSEDTIKRDIDAFGIPVRHCGGKNIIDASLWWESVWSKEKPHK